MVHVMTAFLALVSIHVMTVGRVRLVRNVTMVTMELSVVTVLWIVESMVHAMMDLLAMVRAIVHLAGLVIPVILAIRTSMVHLVLSVVSVVTVHAMMDNLVMVGAPVTTAGPEPSVLNVTQSSMVLVVLRVVTVSTDNVMMGFLAMVFVSARIPGVRSGQVLLATSKEDPVLQLSRLFLRLVTVITVYLPVHPTVPSAFLRIMIRASLPTALISMTLLHMIAVIFCVNLCTPSLQVLQLLRLLWSSNPTQRSC